MKRFKSTVCIVVALIMAMCCLNGCGDDGAGENPNGKASYTVTFDVGAEATSAGVSAPAKQVVKAGGTAVEPVMDYWAGHELVGWYNADAQWNFSENAVNSDLTLTAHWGNAVTADVAAKYESELDWGEVGHLYVHYLRGADSIGEHGTVNDAPAPDYSEPISSAVYGDWGLWVWEYLPTNSEGRTFFPMKLDESGAVYDIDLTAEYDDAGWDSETKTHKSLPAAYDKATQLGIQFFSQDSRVNGSGFWVNDGGNIYVSLADAAREKGDYHWFVRQGETQRGSAKFESAVVDDPYDGLEPGSAVSTYDVVSNKGNNDVYVQQPVAKGWEDNSVGYQIFVASFADSDGDGMGDLQGIIGKLDYLDELGVDTLWLTPFQQSNSYHGYDIKDYFTVDPRFGTLDDYRELLFEAHKRGMKVLMDFVLNHTATSNPWFEKSQKLVKETVKMPDGTMKVIDYRNFYTWQNEDNVPKSGNAAKQWFKDSNGYYYYSSFNSDMPELNFDYQATRDAILQVALYWMSFGLDGFRLDAVKHIYMANENPNHSSQIVTDVSADGDYSFDVKKNAHFFMEFNAKLKASYPEAILVGENFNGDPIKIAGLYGGLDSQFNFNWYYDSTGSLGTIAQNDEYKTHYQYAAKIMNQYAAAQFDYGMYRTDYIDGIFTSNHDVQRARDRVLNHWSDADNDWIGAGATTQADVELSYELAKLWAGMCMTVPGMTWIYNGDELGMFGSKTPNAAGEGSGHEDRWLRQAMKWTKAFDDDAANCSYDIGFNNYKMTWDKFNAELDGVKEQKLDERSIYNAYKSLIALRKQYRAFSRGKVTNTTVAFSEDQNAQTGEITVRGTKVISYRLSDGVNTFDVYVNACTAPATCGRSGKYEIGGELVYSTSGQGFDGDVLPALTLAIYKVTEAA